MRPTLLAFMVMIVASCKVDAPPPQTPAPEQPERFSAEVNHTRGGWVGHLLAHPETFTALTSESPGWALLWKGRLRRAVAAFSGDTRAQRIGRGRALLSLGTLLSANNRWTQTLVLDYAGQRAKIRKSDQPLPTGEGLYAAVALGLTGKPEASVNALDRLLEGGAAEPFAGQARLWRAHFATAPGTSVTWPAEGSASLKMYLQARRGEKVSGSLPSGSPMNDRLAVGILAYQGKHEEALERAGAIPHREPDQVDILTVGAGNQGAEKIEQRFFSLTYLGDLARAYLGQASATLGEADDCASHYLAKALTAQGQDPKAARTTLAGLQPDPARDFPCLVFSAAQDLTDLQRQHGPAPARDQTLLLERIASAKGTSKIPLPDEETEDPGAILDQLRERLQGPGKALVEKIRSLEGYAYNITRASAAVAAARKDFPTALQRLEATHDEQHSDDFSSLNSPAYLYATAEVNWAVRRRRRAIDHVDLLAKRFPELWQNIEWMKRVDAIEALGDRSAPVMGN